MQLFQTNEFEKDVKRLDKPRRERLRKALEKIVTNPFLGKPMRHSQNTFSERIESIRLIYRVQGQNKILLVCFKSRDDVYEYLKETV